MSPGHRIPPGHSFSQVSVGFADAQFGAACGAEAADVSFTDRANACNQNTSQRHRSVLPALPVDAVGEGETQTGELMLDPVQSLLDYQDVSVVAEEPGTHLE